MGKPPLFVSRLTGLALKLVERLSSIANTWAAHAVVTMQGSSRFMTTASVSNINGNPAAIVIGENAVIRGHLQVFAHAGRIEIGQWFYMGENSRVWSAAQVTIGDRVLIAHNVNVIDSTTHPIDASKRFDQTVAIFTKGHPRSDPGLDSSPIIIEDDVWIGHSATIMKGVRIGRGAIVGAASVVTKDVPAWTLVAGNPARTIRTLDQ
jgi:acetyltransferase-like isoleucine patch superfamily enzyme